MIQVNATSLAQFMEMLLLTGPHYIYHDWLFRGHGDATWGLVPSIRRRESWDRFGGVDAWGLRCNERGVVINTGREVDASEAELLGTVRATVRAMGLPPYLEETDALRAYGRHIGLPTNLLDWTRSPWTAAYFAAARAIEWRRKEGSLCVFAMSTFFLHESHMQSADRLFVNPAGNPNMLAQQGALIVVRGDRPDLLDDMPVDEKPVGYRLDEIERHRLANHLIKITLPWSQSVELLEVLRRQDVHGATVYPGQTGVAELVREVFLARGRMQ